MSYIPAWGQDVLETQEMTPVFIPPACWSNNLVLVLSMSFLPFFGHNFLALSSGAVVNPSHRSDLAGGQA